MELDPQTLDQKNILLSEKGKKIVNNNFAKLCILVFRHTMLEFNKIKIIFVQLQFIVFVLKMPVFLLCVRLQAFIYIWSIARFV